MKLIPFLLTLPICAQGSMTFVPVTPCRIADTRAGFGFTGPFGPPSIPAKGIRSIPVLSSACNVPVIAQGYALNVTVVPPGPLGYVTLWPAGSQQPNASILNDSQGVILANYAAVPAGTDVGGSVNVFPSDAADIIIDISGYWVAAHVLWKVGPGDPNSVIACNQPGTSTPPGKVPYPVIGDEALQDGQQGNTGDSIWRCLTSSTGPGVWVKMVQAQ